MTKHFTKNYGKKDELSTTSNPNVSYVQDATEKDWGLCLNFLLETVLSASGMIDSLATGRILSTYA